MDNINLNSFLKLGCFLDYKFPGYKVDFSGINRGEYRHASLNELVDIGVEKYKNAIRKQFSCNQKHVVPLSGGLDSRGVLAALLELTEARNIYTYTFGTPKTLDYDIGNFIAKKFGTKHTSFPLTEYVYNLDELIDISKRIDHQTVLFHHPPVWELDAMFGDFVVWSGTSIESWFGSHNHEPFEDTDIEREKAEFIRENTYVRSIEMSNVNDECLYPLVSLPPDIADNIPTENILDILNRQQKYICPHVLMKGFDYRVLFTDKELTDFCFSLERKYITNKYLYKRILLKAYPEAFAIGTKSNCGFPLTTPKIRVFFRRALNKIKSISNLAYPLFINPYINYIDFDHAIRHRADLRKIIYENIMDLKKRKLVDWINIDRVWERHISKQTNHADALLVLASLEIHLKAKNG